MLAAIVLSVIAASPARPAPEAPGTAMPDPLDASPELLLYKDIPTVVAAGKREQTQRQAAASVSVIDSEEIELFGYQSLADALRNQRSFNLHTDGLNWFAGVRGFLRPGEWNARMLVLVDGRPTREPIYGQTHLDLDFVVPTEAVKRIEVIRGPGSTLYGGNAVFGVINVVTKDGADVRNWAELKVQGGTHETGRVSALIGKKLEDGWDVMGTASLYNSQGEKEIRYDGVHDAAHNFGLIEGFDSEDVGAIFLKARKGDFVIEGDFARRDRDNRSATFLTSWADPGSMEEERASVTVRFDHELGEGQSVHAMAYYGRYVYKQAWQFNDDGAGHPYGYSTAADTDWLGGEFHHEWQVNKSVHVTLGADATVSVDTHQVDRDSLTGELLNEQPSTRSLGLFAEGEWKAADCLSFTGGIRADWVARMDMQFSPRAAVIVTPTTEDTIKGLYGRAFRAPNLYEMFYASPGANTPNPNLMPEVIDTLELIWERQNADGWRSSLGYYFWKMSHGLGDLEMPDHSLETVNSGNYWAHGVEAEIQKQWHSGARFRAYATLGRAVQKGDELTHSPEWILGSAVAIPLFSKNTILAIEPQIIGPMKSDFDESTDPTFITNLVATSRDVLPGLDIQLGVYNLFAHEARLPRNSPFDHSQPWLNYPGTEVMLTLKYRF